MISSLTSANFFKSLGSHIKYGVTLIAMGGLAVALEGCSAFHEEFSDCAYDQSDESTKPVILRLSVDYASGNNTTRTDNDPDRFDDPTGEFEEIETLRVLIIHELSPIDNTKGVVEANRLVATTSAGIPLYDNLNFEVIPNERKRIYLIANENYLVPPANSNQSTASRFLDSFKPGTETNLNLLSNWVVFMPGTSAVTVDGATVTTSLFSPYLETSKRRLPLTESFDIDVPEFIRNDKDDEDNFIFDAGLFLTRAAAKARFYIATGSNYPDTTDGESVVTPTITAITLSGIGSSEFVFPRDTKYSILEKDDEGNSKKEISKNDIWNSLTGSSPNYPFITSFSTPNDSHQLSFSLTNLINNRIRKFSEPMPLHDRLIYFPESILETGQQFTVGVQLNNREWLYAPLETNILKIEGIDAIARDTYLPITITFNNTTDISVKVLPWNREDYYIDYTDNIGFNEEDYLKISGEEGQTGDFLLLDEETGELVLNYGKAAHGKFYIPSPLGSTWDAYLISTGGAQDAIQFQIPDPVDSDKTITTTHISGVVGQDIAEFGIVATVAPGPVANTAQLMVIVTLANGTPIVANVIGNWACSKNDISDRLSIIENPQ